MNENDLPARVVVGENGAYWRDYGDSYSMCPVSTDNDPVVPVAAYVRIDQLREALHNAIGNADESQGLEHWHHASGGRSDNGERDGVFVDRGEVQQTIDNVFAALGLP